MKKLIATTATLALLVGAGSAIAGFNTGDKLGTTEEEVRAALEAKGVTVEEIETEDGMIEAEFLQDGVEKEVVVNISTGAITEIETEDDSNDEVKDDD